MSTAPKTKSDRTESSRPAPLSPTASGIRRTSTPPPLSLPLTPVVVGLSFLDTVAAKRLDRDNLETWADQHLVAPGYLLRPLRIHEPIFGSLTTDKGCNPFLPESPPTDDTSALLVRARARVIGHLQELLLMPSEDRFLTAAIFSRRVRRTLVGTTMHWTPHPRMDDCLSEIITSLFVSDILTRREFYEQNLCICQRCGRVRFEAIVGIHRHRCFFC